MKVGLSFHFPVLTECWSVVFYARNSLRGSLPYEQSLTGSGFKDSYPGEYFTMTNTYDKGLLLHHASHHPTACTEKGIIYSQALRYRRWRITVTSTTITQNPLVQRILSLHHHYHNQQSHFKNTKPISPTKATTSHYRCPHPIRNTL